VSDSIPLEWAEQNGYERNVVILTQPQGYQKEHNRLMPLLRIGLRKFPLLVEGLDKRHLMYNRQLEYVAEAEREGRCLVIRPDEKLNIGHVCHDPELMERVYQKGREMGERRINEIKEYLCE
jgi:predicted patatin/cPLA2 family phospholipase